MYICHKILLIKMLQSRSSSHVLHEYSFMVWRGVGRDIFSIPTHFSHCAGFKIAILVSKTCMYYTVLNTGCTCWCPFTNYRGAVFCALPMHGIDSNMWSDLNEITVPWYLESHKHTKLFQMDGYKITGHIALISTSILL